MEVSDRNIARYRLAAARCEVLQIPVPAKMELVIAEKLLFLRLGQIDVRMGRQRGIKPRCRGARHAKDKEVRRCGVDGGCAERFRRARRAARLRKRGA